MGAKLNSKLKKFKDYGGNEMNISARNQLKGKVTNIVMGMVNAEVSIELEDGQVVVSVITKSSVENLGIKIGDEVAATIKASSIMVGK